jgi:23S rRNA pseudouridine2605 synthase
MTEAPRKPLSLKRETLPHAGIEERLQKVLANAGLGSRRALDERIAAGEIRVNAQVATPGTTVRGGDRVEIDGKAYIAVPSEPEEAQVLIYHKPEGEVTTHDDPEGRRTVFERLPKLKGARWISVGRLDINTTGLLLITTDGELAHAMMHPSRELAREYVCRVHGAVDEDMLDRLRRGVELDDGPARFDELHVIHLGESHSWFRVVLHEGRNREVRRLWESQGVTVSRLKRIRYGSIELPRELRRGHWRALEPEAYRALRRELGLGDAPMTLTLQAVIGVRRAARSANEFRPAGRGEGWIAGRADEARELRAFDHVRDEGKGRPAKRKPKSQRFGANRGKPGGRGGQGRRGAAPGHDLAGGPGVWQPPAGASGTRPPFKGGKRRPGPNGAAAAHRPGKPNAAAGDRRAGPPVRPRPGIGQPRMPYGFPSDHAYAQRFLDVDGNVAPRPAGGRRKPGRRGPTPGRKGD